MTHGGKREGAGRRKGSRNKASSRREQFIARSGPTPLDVMIQSMRYYWDEAQRELAKSIPELHKVDVDINRALDAAHKAAPFVHPRLAAIDQNSTLDFSKLTPEEIDLVEPILRKAFRKSGERTNENPQATEH